MLFISSFFNIPVLKIAQSTHWSAAKSPQIHLGRVSRPGNST